MEVFFLELIFFNVLSYTVKLFKELYGCKASHQKLRKANNLTLCFQH